MLGLCGSSSTSRSDCLGRCNNSRQVMKNRSHTSKRRRRDMPPNYKPYSARHTEEPLGTVMGTWISGEPQSPYTRDAALPTFQLHTHHLHPYELVVPSPRRRSQAVGMVPTSHSRVHPSGRG